MEKQAHRDLWKEAEELLKAELGEKEWTLFTTQSNPATPQAVMKEMEQLQNRTKGEYTGHTVTIGDKKLFEFNTGRILKRLEILCKMIDSGISSAPVSVGIVWTAFRMLTRLFLNDQELCELLTGAIDQMSDVLFACDIYAAKYLNEIDNIAANILRKIPPLYKTVLRFSLETKKLFPNNDKKARIKIARVLVGMFGSTGELRALVDDATAQMEQLRNMANVKFQSLVEDIVHGMNQELKEVSQGVKAIQDLGQLWHAKAMFEFKAISGEFSKTRTENEKKKVNEEFVRWLSWLQNGTSLNLLQPRDQQHENMKNKSDNTCGWIFDHKEYHEWVRKAEPQILWLSGPAGSGKSFVTSSVIDFLGSSKSHDDAEAPILLYFFCKIGNDTTQKGEKIMLHLLMQLFSKYSSDPNIGVSSLSQDYITTARCIEMLRSRSKTKNYSEKSDALTMTALLSIFVDIIAESGRDLFIVLDALDECIDRRECALLKTLIDLVSTDRSIRLFVSSRPENDISQVFGTDGFISHCRIDVERSFSEADIAKYVNEKLSTAPLSKLDKDKARKAILKKSEGMFQYAAIAVQGLSEYHAAANFPRALKKLPKGMNDLYSREMQSLEGTTRQHLRTILRWMVCAEGSIRAAPIVDEFGTIDQDSDGSDSDGYESSVDSDGSLDLEGSDDTSPSPSTERPPTEEVAGDVLEKLRVNTIMENLTVHVRQFVKFDTSTTVVSLQHASIQDWITQQAKPSRRATMCPECRKRELESSGSTFDLAPKYGHFLMACSILRRLNDPRFQIKYLNLASIEDGMGDLPRKRDQQDSEEGVENVNDTEDGLANAESKQIVEDAPDKVNESQRMDADTREVGVNTIEEPNRASLAEQLAQNTGQAENQNPPQEDSMSHDDVYNDNATDDARSTYGDQPGDNESQKEDNLRYELTHWTYHVRHAELEWPEEERNMQPEKAKWDRLYDDVERFMNPKSTAYKSWLKLAYNVTGVTKYWEAPVRIAAKAGLAGNLKRYIDAGADLWETNEWGNNCLHHVCIGDGDFAGLEVVLEEAAKNNPTAINQAGGTFFETPIMMAASYHGTAQHIETLLAYGAKPDIPDQFGYTCLHYAVKRRDLEMCKLLLGCDGVKVNAKDAKGETPLHWLLKGRNAPLDIARLLINCGADVMVEDNDSQTPLYEAASTGNAVVARLLLEHGADVNDGEDVFGWTALHAAVNDMNSDFVKLLLEYDADILASDNMERNPIAQAANNGQDEILGILLEAQKKKSGNTGFLARPDIKGHTPLHRVAARNRLEMAKMLLGTEDAELLCSQRNIHDATPLHSAARRGNHELVELLLQKGSDSTALDRAGNTPLDLAVRGWKDAERWRSFAFDSTVAMLMDLTTDISKMASTLDLAIEKGAERVCRRLMTHTNTVDEHGWTPLVLAVQERQESITKLLTPLDTTGVLARLSSGRDAEIGVAPTAWSAQWKLKDLIISEDGLEIYRAKNGPHYPGGNGCAISNHPIPAGRSHYYYEVELIPEPENPAPDTMCMGYSSLHARLVHQLPGWAGIQSPSWGYHGDDGCVFSSQNPPRKYPDDSLYGPLYNIGDTVGAGIDFRNGMLFYTKNGERLNNAESGDSIKGRLFPVIGFSPCGVRVRANFGMDPTKPFKYKWKY